MYGKQVCVEVKVVWRYGVRKTWYAKPNQENGKQISGSNGDMWSEIVISLAYDLYFLFCKILGEVKTQGCAMRR